MEDDSSLVANLAMYKEQLNQVEVCLQSAEGESMLADLQQLQSDLKEVIRLTEETLLNLRQNNSQGLSQNAAAENSAQGLCARSSSGSSLKLSQDGADSRNSTEMKFDDEYAAFQMLLGEHLTNNEDNTSADQIINSSNGEDVSQSDHEEETEEQMDDGSDSDGSDDDDDPDEELFGEKCQAPFSFSWGQTGHYNAIIISRVQNDSSDDEPMVEVLFCNPTNNSMRPCPYFFNNGDCRFEGKSCKFSHGEPVKVSDLRPFEEPDFSKICLGSQCLVRDDDDIWYEATVVELFDGSHFQVQFSSNSDLKTVAIEDILPSDHQPDEPVQHSSISEEDPRKTDDDEEEAVCSSFSNPTALPDIKTTDALGQWEAHTKGIGSKLMAKMGYVVGQGLGRNNDGRAEPVPINLLPKGVSLDKIMELKSLAKNDNLFDALKKQKRGKKEQNSKKKSAPGSGRRTESASVFSFINRKLRQTKGHDGRSSMKCRTLRTAKDAKFISAQDLKQKSEKHLNVQLLKTNEEIKNTQRQINQLHTSLARAIERGDHSVSKEIQRKLDSLNKYTNQLRTSETFIQNHKKTRKTHNMLTKF